MSLNKRSRLAVFLGVAMAFGVLVGVELPAEVRKGQDDAHRAVRALPQPRDWLAEATRDDRRASIHTAVATRVHPGEFVDRLDYRLNIVFVDLTA